MIEPRKYFNFKKITDLAIPLLALALLISVISPIYIYFLNSSDISWQGSDWLLLFLKSCLILVPICLLLSKTNRSVTKILIRLTITCYTLIFIRVFFLPVDFGLLDGSEIINTTIISDYSLWFSLLLLIIIFFCSIKLIELFISFVIVSGILGLCFSIYLFITTEDVDIQQSLNAHSSFSSKLNVLVIGFDGIQGDFLQYTFSKNDKLRDKFDGFIFYEDVTGYAPTTDLSLLSTLTGTHLLTGNNGDLVQALRINSRNDSLPTIMARNSFKVDTFNVHSDLVVNVLCNSVSSVLADNITDNYRLTANDVLILKTFPKSFSWKLLEVNLKGQKNEEDEISLIKNDKAGHGHGMEKYAFDEMITNFHLVTEPVFKFHHYLHTHAPIRFDKNYFYNPNTRPDFESALIEMTGAINQFTKLIGKLKKEGIYDKSLIILTSDHGYENFIQPSEFLGQDYLGAMINTGGFSAASRYWPTLMVKLPGAKGEMKFDSKPAELIDIMPTIFDSLEMKDKTNPKIDGYSLLKKQPNRQRKAMIYVGGKANQGSKNIDSRLFDQISFNSDEYSGILNGMRSLSLRDRKLTQGTVLEFNNETFPYISTGMERIDSWGRWSTHKRVRIEFNFEKSGSEPSILTMNLSAFVNSKHPTLQAAALLNGINIGNIAINHGENNPRNFTFDLPDAILRSDHLNTLDFYIENPMSPKSLEMSNDFRQLGIGFRSMCFK